MKLIADINTWYKIADGSFKNKSFFYSNLHLTGWNLLELITSPKLLMPNEKIKVLNTAKFIREFNPSYIEYEPYSYLANKILGIKIENGLKVDFSLLDILIENELNLDYVMRNVDIRTQRVWGFKESIDNQQLSWSKTICQEIKNDPDSHLIGVVQRTILEMEKVLGVSRSEIKNEFLSNFGSDVNFFFWVRKVYDYILHCVKGYKSSKNDQGDILNLIYVGHDDLYWTEDKKWIQNIKDAGLKEKMYNPNN